MLRIKSPLSEELEDLIHRTIGCCIAVHRELGPGLLEHIYARAVCIELTGAGIPFDCEKKIAVMYRGQLLCEQRLDFVVKEELLLEIKSVERLVEINHAQTLSYMRIAHLRAGLLINFNVPILQDGIRRKVL